jgi:hypothetical protein
MTKMLLMLMVCVFGVWMIIQLLPDIKRYLRISSM